MTSIKDYFYAKEIQKAILFNKNLRRDYNRSIKSISILYGEDSPFEVEEINRFIGRMENKGIEVLTLFYSNKTFAKNEQPAEVFTKKDLAFSRIPKSDNVKRFNAQQSDLFYNFLDPELAFSAYLNLVNKSKFRIGLSTKPETGCDLMIKIEGGNLKSFLNTSNQILESMISSSNGK